MSEHKAFVHWTRPVGTDGAAFLKGQYSREHTWRFDGGVTVPGSPSPAVVPAPWSNPANVDPEEAFVAAISSCHLLTFLHVARRAGFVVEDYRDEAVGVMTPNECGTPWVSKVTLNLNITYANEQTPTPEQEEHLHHQAHEECFIANSVKSVIVVVCRHRTAA